MVLRLESPEYIAKHYELHLKDELDLPQSKESWIYFLRCVVGSFKLSTV